MPVSYCGEPLRYSIFDPTGNITALVETPVVIDAQPAVAAFVMREHPEVEQVGYVRFIADAEADDGVHVELRMAGGEFCGNATMSAAVYHAIHQDPQETEVLVEVSGAPHPLCVSLKRENKEVWQGTVEMPLPDSIAMTDLPGGYHLPVVQFEGIAHVILEDETTIPQAQKLAERWCSALRQDAIGLLYFSRKESVLKPLVCVPGANTLCWENACGSGTAAVGAYLCHTEQRDVSLSLRQPGGILTIQACTHGSLRLSGTVKCVHQRTVTVSL